MNFFKLFIILSYLLVLPIEAFSFPLFKQFSSDHRAIKKMSGCYEVTYQFSESKNMNPKLHTPSKDYHETGLEWITVDQESKNEISLQHILIIGNELQKHWRQVWTKNPTSSIEYLGDNTWERKNIVLNSKKLNNLWSQVVYQVDDSPRYGCLATWTHGFFSSSWQCTHTLSPLPRREFSQRSDYNLLMRENIHEIKLNKWFHKQFNHKIIQNELGLNIIAQEEGQNTYKKVSAKNCKAAKVFWKVRKNNWHLIQDMWKHVFEHHPKIAFKNKVDNKTLWMMLFELEEQYSKAEKNEESEKKFVKNVHDTIHLFMKNH